MTDSRAGPIHAQIGHRIITCHGPPTCDLTLHDESDVDRVRQIMDACPWCAVETLQADGTWVSRPGPTRC